MARRRRRSRTVFETRSRVSGRIRVVDYRLERRLLVSGEILSVYPLDGDWSRVRREYWWRALAAIELPPPPTALSLRGRPPPPGEPRSGERADLLSGPAQADLSRL